MEWTSGCSSLEHGLGPGMARLRLGKEGEVMLACSQCRKEFKPGTVGWYARIEGPVSDGRGGGPLKRILLCPDDFKKLPATRRMAWHEYLGETRGPTREKRPGHLGEAV